MGPKSGGAKSWGLDRIGDRLKPFCWALLQDDGGGAGSVTKEIKSGSFVSPISPPPLQYSR